MSDIKLIMMVGGFSASPHLMKRVRDSFIQYQVEEVISPPNPGSAVCQGDLLCKDATSENCLFITISIPKEKV